MRVRARKGEGARERDGREKRAFEKERERMKPKSVHTEHFGTSVLARVYFPEAGGPIITTIRAVGLEKYTGMLNQAESIPPVNHKILQSLHTRTRTHASDLQATSSRHANMCECVYVCGFQFLCGFMQERTYKYGVLTVPFFKNIDKVGHGIVRPLNQNLNTVSPPASRNNGYKLERCCYYLSHTHT